MKRFLLAFLIIFVLASPITTFADVLFDPENQFYTEHSDKCVYLGRSFYTNGANGSVSVKNAPDLKSELYRTENNEIVYIEFSCLYDGEYWGLIPYNPSFGIEKSGWVRMDELLVLYDYVSFEEEYIDEFYQYKGDYKEIKEAKSAIVWSWPGSGNARYTLNDMAIEQVHVSYAFKDEQGREWGFVPYLYGDRNFWICISDPVNRDIPAFKPASEPVKWKTDTIHTEIEKTDNSMIIIIAVLVGALVLGTAVLIKVIWKPQKESMKKED